MFMQGVQQLEKIKIISSFKPRKGSFIEINFIINVHQEAERSRCLFHL